MVCHLPISPDHFGTTLPPILFGTVTLALKFFILLSADFLLVYAILYA